MRAVLRLIKKNLQVVVLTFLLLHFSVGLCDQSYGLQVARSIGLPADLITDAETASAKEEKLESMWVRLEEFSHRPQDQVGINQQV